MVVEYTIKTSSKPIKCAEFDGFYDQLNYIKDFIKKDPFGIAKEVNQSDSFFGEHTLSQSIDGMTYGFQKSTDYMMSLLQTSDSETIDNNGIKMDVEGFAYDMGSVIEGIPECCISMNAPSVTPCITILVDLSFNGGVSAKQIFNRGVAITTLIEHLLLTGCIVDLYFMECDNQSDIDTMYINKVDTRSLAISNIAFACSPEYFRKIGWCTTDKLRNKASSWGRGSSKLTQFMINKIKRDKIFFIGGNFSDSKILSHLDTPQKAIDYICNTFNKFCTEHKLNLRFKREEVTSG